MKLSLDRPDIEKTPRIYFFDADDSTICGRDDGGEVVHLESYFELAILTCLIIAIQSYSINPILGSG